MLTGGVIHAAESGSGAVPDGFVISPAPGAQDAVPVITFCAKNAPAFSNLMVSSLSGNYITVTAPSGESRDVNLYGDTENTASGNFFADPGFNEPGEWTITTHFSSIQYMGDDILNMYNLPEEWKEFSFSYTLSRTSDNPTVKVNGEAASGTTIQFYQGETQEITFAEVPSDIAIYYSWMPESSEPALPATDGYVRYENPLTVAESGEFAYYAEQDGIQYGNGSLTFTMTRVMTEENFTITPAPGKYEEWTADRITFTKNAPTCSLNTLRNKEIMSITNPAGETRKFTAVRSSSTEIYFELSDFIGEKGTYTVEMNFDGYNFTLESSPAIINPISFTYQIGAEETDQIPEGMIVSPAPGAQDAVPVITFCAKNAPAFSNLMVSSLSGNYITVTAPSGESRDVNLYGDTENTASGNFFADPGFNEPGEWTITTHFSSIQYMGDDILNMYNLPEEWKEFSFSYTLSRTSDNPTVKVNGEGVSGTTIQFYQGETEEITFAEVPSDIALYYSWTPKASEPALPATDGYVRYESPVSIAESGEFAYYAEQDGIQYGNGSMTFTMTRIMTEEDFTITPAPGKYEEWTADRITFTKNAPTCSLNTLRNKEIMSITNPAGETRKFTAVRTSSTEIYFELSDFIGEKGTYTVEMNFDGYNFTLESSLAIINPISFTYELDIETGIGRISAESEDAEYYDLTGRRVRGELSPGIYIVRDQDKTYKRIIK